MFLWAGEATHRGRNEVESVHVGHWLPLNLQILDLEAVPNISSVVKMRGISL